MLSFDPAKRGPLLISGKHPSINPGTSAPSLDELGYVTNKLWPWQLGGFVLNMPKSLLTISYALYSTPKALGCWSAAFLQSDIPLLNIGRTVVPYYRFLGPPNFYPVNRCHP